MIDEPGMRTCVKVAARMCTRELGLMEDGGAVRRPRSRSKTGDSTRRFQQIKELDGIKRTR
jgi:hypothetical protein